MRPNALLSRPAPPEEAAEPAAAAAGARRAEASDALGAWCGWVLTGAALLTPLIAWLAPLGFAPLLAVMGLLCLPALRPQRADRPMLLVMGAAFAWACVSMAWSPFHPKSWSNSTALQLALALPLGWSAVCGARRAEPRLARLALRTLTWGLALLGVVLAYEALTAARLYTWLHVAFYEPIRPDLAQRNVAQATYVTAALWPLCMGAVERRREAFALAPAVVGTVMAAHVFDADAPVIAAPLALIVAMVVWRLPRLAPAALGLAAAALFELMPVAVWVTRASGDYGLMERDVPLSWAYRLDYWSRTTDWIARSPFRGWGLDASRSLPIGISLHPHNNPLQVWLELGLPGVLLAAGFWGLAFQRLARPRASWPACGGVGAACVFLLYACANFGAWQAWFLGVGGLLAAFLAAQFSAQLGATGEADA